MTPPIMITSSCSRLRGSICALLALTAALAFGAEKKTGLGGTEAEPFQPGPPEAAARYAANSWNLVWSDEFSDGPHLDAAKWSFEHGMLRNNEAQFYTDRLENAKVSDGNLTITARREPWEKASYTSASLDSKFKFTYGKVEVRARIPTGRGTWPAIWMLGNGRKYRWPECGEIDIMENVGFDPQAIHFTTHTGAFNHVIHTQRGHAVTLEHPWQEFHRYGLIWTPQKLEYFLDGEKVSEFANDGQGHSHWPFDEPEHLKINFALGGGWGGQHGIDDSIFPVTYDIDYVRIWQSKAAAPNVQH
jgi:beta-glucanase (GH16 family)